MVNQEQKYMRIALTFVEDAKSSLSSEGQNEYDRRVQSAPALIHDTGLMQTLAFFISKNDNAFNKLAQHLLCWLNVNCGENWGRLAAKSNWELFLSLKDISTGQLMMNTEKTLKLLQWLKRFSASQLKKD